MQEALLAAALQWPADGRPRQSQGLVDHRRVSSTDRDVAQRVGSPASGGARRLGPRSSRSANRVPDGEDTLTLLLLCCHPALTPVSQVALTLRAVGGLTTSEIARAFLVPDKTVGPAHQPGEAAHPGQRRRIPHATGSRALGADGVGAPRAVPDLQRGLHRELRLGAASRRAVAARRSASPARYTTCCPTTARSPGCSR